MYSVKKLSSLVPVKTVDNIEAYIVSEKPAVSPGSSLKAIALISNKSSTERNINVKIKYQCSDGKETLIYDGQVKIGSMASLTITTDVPLGEKHGEHKLVLYINDKIVDESLFIVDEPLDKPTLFTIVWHHHQAPNYTPDGKIHAPWAFVYVWGAYLSPYGYGPYHYHSVLLSKKPGFKTTYNLSPSLLKQWLDAIERGIVFTDGKKLDSNTPEIELVRETLENYRNALHRGQIDVLTSIYAHTIGGFLVDVLDASDIVDEEISYGKEITRKAMGSNYDATGIWTPEMAFSMGLIPIYASNGIKYTVLDDQHHFRFAEGDKNSQYEPYLVINSGTGDYITVFFRDHELSDIIGFMNVFMSEHHAWRNAYETAYRILKKALSTHASTLVLALDGENWMVFSKNPPMTAYYLDKLSDYLISIDQEKFMKLSHLREMLEKCPPQRVLKHIPTNSWLGTFRKWRGEKQEHEEYWIKVVEKYRILKAYERIIGKRDEVSTQARWCLWHALDSDYWWAEFWSPKVIDMWLNEFEKTVPQKLSLIKISDIEIAGEPVEGGKISILIKTVNKTDKEIKPIIRVRGIDIRIEEGSEIKPIVVKPMSSYDRVVKARVLTWGRVFIIAAITADGYIIDVKTKEFYVKPFIRPNPV
ncbi:glycoside hydrolase [Desulfurococcaceae archaeon MEX13E-LK6-19]|nr:glycoside hydrolase [Desulfurococcaceae archaeon MEX13E-LK6-19]